MPSIGGDKTSASISLSGLPELDAKFNKLEKKLRTSIGKKALRQASNVTLKYAREYVLKDTKKLSKGIKTKGAEESGQLRHEGRNTESTKGKIELCRLC